MAEPSQREEQARAIVGKLCSAEAAGRGAGSPGLGFAAKQIEAELKKIGLVPAYANESYREAFPYFAGTKLGATNSLEEAKLGAATAQEFTPLAFSISGSAENLGIVFAGYGIQARDEKGK